MNALERLLASTNTTTTKLFQDLEARVIFRYDELVSKTKLKDITSDKINRKILHRLKNNDRDFDSMSLSIDHTDGRSYSSSRSIFCPSGLLELGWLGYFIGKNKHLTNICLGQDLGSDAEDVTNFSRQHMAAFGRGFVNNKSIRDIEFNRCQLVEPEIFQLMGAFFQNNHSLVGISFTECHLSRECAQYLPFVLETCAGSLEFFQLIGCQMDDDSLRGVFGALRMHSKLENLRLIDTVFGRNRYTELATLLRGSFTNLQRLCLQNTTIDNESLHELVMALTENNTLKELDLDENSSITPRGFRCLSTLLEHPNCSLEELNLSGNNVDDEAAILFANALASNQLLKTLNLEGTGISTKGGDTAFVRLLCDASSINNTFLSNHTLNELWFDGDEEPSDPDAMALCDTLISSLDLNQTENKTHVAVNKILKHHSDFSMHSFLKWDLRMMPLVISWLERARDCARDFEAGIEQRKLSAIYQFAKDLSWLFDERSLALNQSMRLG